MASIRRSLSPANPYRNAPSSPAKLPASPSPLSSSFTSSAAASSSSSSPSSIASQLVRCILMGPLVFQKQHRKWPPPWRRSLVGFAFLFAVGFLLGAFPFAGPHDWGLSTRDFSFHDGGASRRNPPSGDRQLGRVDVEIPKEGEDGEVAVGDLGGGSVSPPRKQLIVVTPTYNRPLQAYYLSRLGQTLMLVPGPLLWIVVEMDSASMETAKLLQGTRVMYRHLVAKSNATDPKDRGVHQRNAALEHIERHRFDGIVYFADDDNVYSLELFVRLRDVRRFGTWPVAMLAQSKSKAILEGPVCNGSEVIGWHTNEKSKTLRRFHVDMSGFAFNSTILWDPKRWNRPTSDPIRQLDTVKEGFQETTFIEQVVEDESQMEGLPAACSEIMNWHLHLETGSPAYPSGWQLSKNLDLVVPLR